MRKRIHGLCIFSDDDDIFFISLNCQTFGNKNIKNERCVYFVVDVDVDVDDDDDTSFFLYSVWIYAQKTNQEKAWLFSSKNFIN